MRVTVEHDTRFVISRRSVILIIAITDCVLAQRRIATPFESLAQPVAFSVRT
jgi:hypothetical protein